MKLMDEIISIDEEYLIGLSNKGIVKRALKDLEGIEPSSNYGEDKVEVSLGGEKCTIVLPLGNSSCTCPSRSVCRHIIAAILWLKNNLEVSPQVSEGDTTPLAKEVCASTREAGTITEETMPRPFGASIQEALEEELKHISTATLKKAMKPRYFRTFLQGIEKGDSVTLKEGTVLEGKLPQEETTVRILSPLEHSTCSCHSKELCAHKAAVILAWQIKKGICSLESLQQEEDENIKLDIYKIKSTAERSGIVVRKVLEKGLVRLPADTPESLELAAVACHEVGLAELERQLRQLGRKLQDYCSRKASFKINEFSKLLFKCHALINKIINSQEEKKILEYMGTFKEKYLPAGELTIMPIGHRFLRSDSGYEGNIYYFINKSPEAKEKYLTYSELRPVFYEQQGLRQGSGKDSAPWGINGSIDLLLHSELKLKHAKVYNGRLSASKETEGHIIASANLRDPAVLKLIKYDFYELIVDAFKDNKASEQEKLALIAPRQCIASGFDEVRQEFIMLLEDYQGRRLEVRAAYKQGESKLFNTLEALGNSMVKNKDKNYVIFGSIHIKEGECYVYPIEIYDSISERAEGYGANKVEKINQGKEHKAAEYIMGFFRQLEEEFLNLLQCGINSYAQGEVFLTYAQEASTTGLLSLEAMLNKLGQAFNERNHSFNENTGKIMKLMEEINSYVALGRKRLQINMAIDALFQAGLNGEEE